MQKQSNRSLEDALDRAWDKIQAYCAPMAWSSTQDIMVKWRVQDDEWDGFGVTPDGTAFLAHGNRDGGEEAGYDDIQYYDHPLYTNGDDVNRYQHLEDLVRNWKQVKRMLKAEMDELSEIYDFEA